MLCLLLSLVSFFSVIHDGWCFASRAAVYQGKQSRSICTMSLFDRIRAAIIRQQPDQNIDRVVQCWDRFATGVGVERYLDSPQNKVLQTADCFVEGLSAMPFHDTETFDWALNLEKHYKEIYSELDASNKRQKATQRLTFSAESDWLPPRDTAGSAYGPEWKTLGLQDRSVWDEDRVLEFPETVRLLKKFDVPSCEVFFAKQGPKSGIKPHSDKNNFIITCHLALDVPEGECWIQVGDTKYEWKNGKAVIFDTSILHSTGNTSDKERYVLLIRFWHPQLTLPEQKAFKFIFELLDVAALGDEALDKFEFESIQTSVSAFMGKDNHKGLSTTPENTNASKKKNSSDRKEKKITGSSSKGGGGFGASKK